MQPLKHSSSFFIPCFLLGNCFLITVNSQFGGNPFAEDSEDVESNWKPPKKMDPPKKMEPPGSEMFPMSPNLGNKHLTCNTEKSGKGNSSLPNCVTSIKNFGLGNLVPGTSARKDGLVPEWIDIPLAKKGQKFFGKHFGAIFLSYLTTTMLFVMTPQIAEVVLFSGNSDTVEKFSRRYTGTASQFSLYSRDIFGEGSNTQNILNSMTTIRRKHLSVAERVNAEMKKSGHRMGLEEKYANYTLKYPKFWEAVHKDVHAAESLKEFRNWPKSYSSTEESAVPINQFVLGMSLWTLCGLAVGFPEAVLIHSPSDEDLIAFNHFFAVFGYGLGIQDEYNTALQPSIKEQKKFYKDILFHYFIPSLYNSTKYSKIMAETISESLVANFLPVVHKSEGVSSETPVSITMDGLMIRLLKDYVGIKADHLEAASSPETKAFTKFYEGSFRPASYLPGFHQGVTHVANAVLRTAGVKTFGPEVYSTDESISLRAYLPE